MIATHRKAVLAWVALALALAPATVAAQTTICGQPLEPDSPLGWQSAKGAAPDRSQETAERILRARFEAAALTWPATIAAPATAAFEALDAGTNPPANFTITKKRVDPDSLAMQQGVFFDSPYYVELPVSSESPLCATEELRRARREFATAVQGVADAEGDPIGKEAAELARRFRELEKKYDRYLFEGFPMFPWEAAVNSWFLAPEHIAEGPPRSQIVFLHPAAGLVGSAESNAESDTGATLSIEPLGWVRYTQDYRHWMGVSLLATFPADREPGYGVAVNYDMFKLGVTWHDDDDDRGRHDGAAVFVGIDLYKFLDSRHRKYDGYRKRVDTLFKEQTK